METGKYANMRGCNSAKVIQVIRTITPIGEGTEKNPVRYKFQYWDLEGHLLAEQDELSRNCD